MAHLETDIVERSNENDIGHDREILKLKLDGHFNPFGAETSSGSPQIDCWL